jgi:hypothetical protein
MKSRPRVLLFALCLLATAGCTSTLREVPLLNRLTGDTKILPALPADTSYGEPVEGDRIDEGGPIISAPTGIETSPTVIETPSSLPPGEIAPPPRVVPEQPMAKPMPFTPEEKETPKPPDPTPRSGEQGDKTGE